MVFYTVLLRQTYRSSLSSSSRALPSPSRGDERRSFTSPFFSVTPRVHRRQSSLLLFLTLYSLGVMPRPRRAPPRSTSSSENRSNRPAALRRRVGIIPPRASVCLSPSVTERERRVTVRPRRGAHQRVSEPAPEVLLRIFLLPFLHLNRLVVFVRVLLLFFFFLSSRDEEMVTFRE